MNKFIKKFLGIDKLEQQAQEAAQLAKDAEEKAQKLVAIAEAAKIAADAAEQERIEKQRQTKLTPKQLATEKKEPWFDVIAFHTNPDNPRFGFWELDWNEYKVLELKADGYYGETDEEVIDQWFREICTISAKADGVDVSRRSMGFIDVKNIGNGRSEVS